MIILIRAAVFGTNTTYVCYYDLTRSAMSGSKRQRVTPQQRDDFATCSASEQQWLERNSKMTIAGCNEELGFPIAQVDEVMHMVMHTYIMMHMLILQVWGWFQQLTVEHNLTRKFTAHDFCMALKQHHTYRAKSQCRQLDINTHFYSVECNETVFKKRVVPCLYRIAEVLRAYRPQIIKPLDRKQGDFGEWNHVELFPFNVTFIPDGLPYVTWQPTKWEYEVKFNRDVQALLGWTDDDVRTGRIGLRYMKSGKYKQAILKGHLIIGLHGLILKHSAHLGVDNDTLIMDAIMEEDSCVDCDEADENAMWELEEDEWGLGDKAYCGIKQMLCGNKPEETEFDTFWNSLI